MKPARIAAHCARCVLAVTLGVLPFSQVSGQRIEASQQLVLGSVRSGQEVATRGVTLGPSEPTPQTAPGEPLRPRVGEAQKRGLAWGAGIGALSGLTIGIVAAANRECRMDCLVGTPVMLPLFGAVGGAMAGGAVGFVVGSVVDHRRLSRAYLAASISVGRP